MDHVKIIFIRTIIVITTIVRNDNIITNIYIYIYLSINFSDKSLNFIRGSFEA